jgi:hypothetical protein
MVGATNLEMACSIKSIVVSHQICSVRERKLS